MGQASPDMPHPQVGETDQPLGNPSQVHQVAGEDEKGDGHEGKEVHSLEHFLGYEGNGVLSLVDGDSQRSQAQAEGNGDPQEQRDSKDNE